MRGKRIDEKTERLILRFYDEGFTIKQVAIALGLSAGAVFNHIKAADEIRTSKDAYKYTVWHIPQKNIDRIRMLGKSRRSEETRRRLSESKKIHGIGHKKKRVDGYISVFYRDHPDSNKEGYLMEHRLVMENHIGRRLGKGEVVHHINGDRSDNRIDNLVLMTMKDHMSMHMTERHKKRREEKNG